MRVAIRTDASSMIGDGHVGRCLALGQALRGNGHDVHFLCATFEGNRIHQITAAGFPLDELPAGDWAEDAANTLLVLETFNPDWVVVDSYVIDERWERQIKSRCGALLVIDDLANRRHQFDIIVDTNRSTGDDYAALVPDDCEILIGPEFSLLRQEFLVARRNSSDPRQRIKEEPLNFLIFFGTVDRQGLTLRTLDALDLVKDRAFLTHVVVTGSSLHRDEILKRCGGNDRIVVHNDIADMAGLLSNMDLAIGGGGISTWERCCLGVPSLTIKQVENQHHVIERAAQTGAIHFIGEAAETTAESLATEIAVLACDSVERNAMTRAGRKLVDGNGAERVVAFMKPKAFT